jgi:hypothetical protein
MDRSDASALADLQMHWDEAYVIGLDGDIWSATFHGSADELRAHTSAELRELIRSDYAYRQRADLAADDRDDEEGYGEEDPGDEDEEEEDPGDEDDGDGEGEADDARTARRPDPERVNFAAIHGERMST